MKLAVFISCSPLAAVVLFIFLCSISTGADLYSDTWVATDALGRQLPDYGECGLPKENKYVGIFYFLWHGEHGTDGPYDITKVLAANPTDPQWPGTGMYWWGEPEAGYYLAKDPWVIRRNASMLADAGVDVIIFDVTNTFTYYSVYMQLCSVYQQMRDEGNKTPQIAFLTHTQSPATVTELYNSFYNQNLYPDLWFYWQGKPLILGYPDGIASDNPVESVSQGIRDFFTWRESWAWDAGYHKWQWLDSYPQDYGWDVAGVPEEIPVGVAQHPVSNIGRSYHNGSQPSTDVYSLCSTTGEGLYFAEQWQRALEVDPDFVFITGWNEWTAHRFIAGDPGTEAWTSFLGQPVTPGQSLFIDCYNQEFSRDIEPMKGGHTDNYYYQMISNIRKFKGVRRQEQPSPSKTISIDGDFSDWTDVRPEFRDTTGDTAHRDYAGWGTINYTNSTGRNDIIRTKVAYDANNIYFYAETRAPLTSYTDTNWMLLFIDSDQNSSTGWQGYDILVNSQITSSTTTILKQTTNGWNWTGSTQIPYKVLINRIEMAIPRSAIGQGSGQSKISFDFHWADNIQKPNDIAEFFVSGDSAPNRRANYCYEVVPTDNLLSNGSFEDPDIATYQVGLPLTDWLLWGGTFFIIDEVWQGSAAADGTQFLETDMGAPTSTNMAHALTITPGTTYTVSFNYTGNAGQAGTEGVLIRTFDMVDGAPANICDHSYTYAGTNSNAEPDWQYAEFDSIVAAGATLTYVSILGQSWGAPEGPYMWIDDIKVTPKDNVINGSFESPDVASGDPGYELFDPIYGPNSWFLVDSAGLDGCHVIDEDSTYLWGGLSTSAADGNQFVQLRADTALYQIIPLTPCQAYTVSFNYTGNAGQDGMEGILFRTYDMVDSGVANIVDQDLYYSGSNSAANPDWQSASYQFTVSARSNATAIEFLGHEWFDANAAAHMWIDNITITPVDNLLTNGSFELPDVLSGTPGYFYLLPPNAPDGWVLVDVAGEPNDQCFIIDEKATLWSGGTSAADCDQFLQIREDTMINQQLTLQPDTYNLSLNYTGNVGQTGTEAVRVRTYDVVDSNVVNTVDRDLYYSGSNSAANPDWQSASYQFTVSSGVSYTVIEFLGRGFFDPNAVEFMWIDNVEVLSIN